MISSDLHLTGTVQTFTAPVDGIYQFELWGSPGGHTSEAYSDISPGSKQGGGKGGYTKMFVRVNSGQIYVIVGGSGNPAAANVTVGGYNGGGSVSTCGEGAHAGSGGGMTHVSYTPNVANVMWDPTGTIAVAGGGGGSGDKCNTPSTGGAGGGLAGGSGTGFTVNKVQPHLPNGATQTSGYRQGVGEPCANSGGGGGGWYGGYSTGQRRVTGGGNCHSGGGGGSGYICEAGKQTHYTPDNLCLVGTDASIPKKPNSDNNGYVRVLFIER